jgi:hypothetical protein
VLFGRELIARDGRWGSFVEYGVLKSDMDLIGVSSGFGRGFSMNDLVCFCLIEILRFHFVSHKLELSV